MRGLAGEGAEGGGLIGGEDGGGRATDAAGARNPSGVVAGIEGQEEGLGGGADLGPDHEGGALDQLPPGGDGDDGPPGHQGRQELDPGFVLGLHFQHIVGPRQRLRGAEGEQGLKMWNTWRVEPRSAPGLQLGLWRPRDSPEMERRRRRRERRRGDFVFMASILGCGSERKGTIGVL